MEQQVKRAFKYRFHPTDEQAAELSRTFGCALRHLQTAFGHFFAKRAEYPRYKSREKSRASAEYTRSAFTWRDGRLTPAKTTGPLDIRWSRQMPEGAEPTTATVSRDPADQTVVIEDLTVRNLVKNGRLARAISDVAWTDLRMMLEYECAWYGRELVVIGRFFPSGTQCGNRGTVREKLPLNVREWTCDNCGAVHDRDANAARDILAAGPAASACGDGVRPQRESSRTGRSSVKQETQRATAGIPRLQTGEEADAAPDRRVGERVRAG
ncbi:RNA-guided endonuclease InsQ/TnpB family protein [Streptomyces sp. NBC_00582]|uniref:RNA-guided endonuclease InsQ/TnpB family protein n=1 Tax=Streptomyces sp. NBC_00582 TaxID=2975783 RepID=UPI002E811185|nr:RNA-guided endonuclease TnpB family protein [Streptomyces sp. NBC_00582]WUB65580.1 transposase [Streptomyces sp. NBC_00582]